MFSLEKIEISGLGSPWIFQINVHLQGPMITTERIICFSSVLQFELNCITFLGSRLITFSVKL